MIHTISNKISEHLIEHGLPKEKQEIYTYGCESFLNLFLCNFILITYAIIIGKQVGLPYAHLLFRQYTSFLIKINAFGIIIQFLA